MTPKELDELARISQRIRALLAQRDDMIRKGFHERGPEDASVTAIAEAAGMTRAGIHHIAKREP